MAFMFRLEHEDGTPADPPTFRTAIPNWRVGHRIPLRPGAVLQVVETRLGEDEQVLLVERTDSG